MVEEVGRIEIINLETRTDRRRQVAKELERLGIDSKDPAVRFFPAMRPADADNFPSIGARGCFLSHLAVLEQAEREQHEAVFILEDDVRFAAPERIAQALEGLRAVDWDIFYGGYDPLDLTGEGLIKIVAPDMPIRTTHCLAFRARAIRAAVPYLKAILERPAGSPEGGPMHVDGAYSWFRRAHPHLLTVVADPQIATQRPSRTDIHALGLLDRLPIVRTLFGLARRLR